MKKSEEQPKNPLPHQVRDDLLGKNSGFKSKEDPFCDSKPRRKRTEDLGDSL